ncbi:MAG: hemolysin family protein, partial [Candidatus Dadabacteria bacterium]|nr:hemolysin family protein [Candidatus Dadabacteria bacterium]MDE0520189.1 hemolysin family protein [Candidatus Dadabacteria bacterium]MDE0663427.1 hemolysin family protein [Candidatus Dadabacteria bacterium]
MSENFILILFLLCCSAFFCFSEGALFSLSRPQRESISKQGGRVSAAIGKLLSNSHKLITTVLLADEIFNIAYSSVIALTAREYLQDTPEQTVALISLAIASPTLLVFGEIVPKTAGVKFPRTISKAVALPLYSFHVAVTPIRWAILFVSGFFIRAFGAGLGHRAQGNDISSDELEVLVGMGRDEGVLNEVEKYLADGFFKLEDLPAHGIMTPAIDCFTLPHDIEVKEAVGRVRQMGRSRIPVYEEEKDNIVGVLYGKDLLKWNFTEHNLAATVSECLRKPYFIPRSKPAGALLRELQMHRIHIAIVVDEYGRFDGLVTMEDILEELFGEIEDERSVPDKSAPAVRGGAITIPGGMKIEEFNDDYLFSVARSAGLGNLGDILEEAVIPLRMENETMGGFVFDLFGRLPAEGEKIGFGGLVFTVKSMEGKRISEIRVDVNKEARGDVH